MHLTLSFKTTITNLKLFIQLVLCIILIQDKYFVLCSFGFRLTISGMNV